MAISTWVERQAWGLPREVNPEPAEGLTTSGVVTAAVGHSHSRQLLRCLSLSSSLSTCRFSQPVSSGHTKASK